MLAVSQEKELHLHADFSFRYSTGHVGRLQLPGGVPPWQGREGGVGKGEGTGGELLLLKWDFMESSRDRTSVYYREMCCQRWHECAVISFSGFCVCSFSVYFVVCYT